MTFLGFGSFYWGIYDAFRVKSQDIFCPIMLQKRASPGLPKSFRFNVYEGDDPWPGDSRLAGPIKKWSIIERPGMNPYENSMV
jgi:hypothetical protein